jgi:hypothetical protein
MVLGLFINQTFGRNLSFSRKFWVRNVLYYRPQKWCPAFNSCEVSCRSEKRHVGEMFWRHERWWSFFRTPVSSYDTTGKSLDRLNCRRTVRPSHRQLCLTNPHPNRFWQVGMCETSHTGANVIKLFSPRSLHKWSIFVGVI